jgi:hypothetical protein
MPVEGIEVDSDIISLRFEMLKQHPKCAVISLCVVKLLSYRLGHLGTVVREISLEKFCSPRIAHVNEFLTGAKLFNTENRVCVAVDETICISSVVSTVRAGGTCLHQ